MSRTPADQTVTSPLSLIMSIQLLVGLPKWHAVRTGGALKMKKIYT